MKYWNGSQLLENEFPGKSQSKSFLFSDVKLINGFKSLIHS